jgi:succinate dehydrogenase / fumarate reductase cytochrome b subunit
MTRRPTFINLFLIKLPITAISSISHRLSGIVNFFIAIPTFVLFFLTDYLVDENMKWSEEKFNFEVQILISASLLAITYHIFAGLRHLITDFSNHGHEFHEAKLSAVVAFALTFIVSFFLIMEVW